MEKFFFELLYEITKINPIPKEYNGRLNRAIIHWLEWYENSEIRKTDDVYHGLINSI